MIADCFHFYTEAARIVSTILRWRTEVSRNHVLITDGGKTEQIVAAVEALILRPIIACNYSDALLKALDHFPSLFVICVSPNDQDCWKFAERIRSDKSLRSFPILFVGGEKVSDADTENAVNYHAKGLLLRPLSLDVVKSEIERILKRTL